MIYPSQGPQRITMNSISTILDPNQESSSSSTLNLLNEPTATTTKEPGAVPLEHVTFPTVPELEEAAKACRLHPKKMTDLERSIFPRFSKLPNRRAYLEVRNVVLYLWLKKPARWLKYDQVLEFMAKTMHRGTDQDMVALANNTYHFLHRYRYINYGVLTMPKWAESPTAQTRRPVIVIVGAGIAGLTAAREINNLFSVFPSNMRPLVTLLEARQRLGGRIFSYPLHLQPPGLAEPVRVDLGADDISGLQGGNPLSVILEHQLKTDLVYLEKADQCKLYNHHGRHFPTAIDDECDALFESCLEKASRTVFDKQGHLVLLKQGVKEVNEHTEQTLLDEDQPPKKAFDMSVYPSLGQVLDYYFHTSRCGQQKTMRDNYAAVVNWHIANMESSTSACIDDLSLHNWDPVTDFVFEGPHAQVKGGLSKLVEGTFIGRPSQDSLNVQSNSVVTDIRIQRPGEDGTASHPEDGLVHITCENGQSYICDGAILTLPLGVLKENKLAFHPPLPQWKRDAIEQLGFGAYNKIIMVFPHCFWNPYMELMGVVNDKDTSVSKEHVYRSCRGRHFSFWNLYPSTRIPILVAYTSGQAALDMEQQSDDQVVIQAMQMLAKVYDRKRPLPWPTESLVTRWSRDPFARGGQSYVPTGATGVEYDTLSQPIWNKVFWAGDATCRDYPSTVHGAVLSGMRAASSIADALLGIVDDTTVDPTANDVVSSTRDGCMRRHCQHSVPTHLSLLDHVVRYHGAEEMRDVMKDFELTDKPVSRDLEERGFQNFREEWRRELATELNATLGTLKTLDRHLTDTWDTLTWAQKMVNLKQETKK